MKDTARINRIIEALRAVWLTHPDQRLGQLLENVSRHTLRYQGYDLFYLSDEDLEKGLRVYPRVLTEA